jgi:hypothetical protein
MTNEEQDLYYGWMFASPWARLKVILRVVCVVALWLIGLGVALGIILRIARL